MKTENMNYLPKHIKLLLFAIIFLTAATGVLAAEGDLDLSFDGDGIVTTDNGTTDERVLDLVIQPDGKIIAVGLLFINSVPRTVIVRYNANGSIDSSFGTSGKVIVESVSTARSALQADGKIVLAGSKGAFPNNDSYVARLNSDGSFDTTFNGTGTVTLDLRATSDSLSSVIIQPDGKIVAGGSSVRSAETTRRDFVIIRFNADGSLDPAFDGDGKVFTMIPPTGETSNVSDLAVQPDGKIVAAGSVSIIDTPGDDPDQIFAIVRYNADGSIDTTFDGDGVANPRFLPASGNGGTSTSVPRNIFARNDGKILVVGNASTCCGPFPKGQGALVQFNADGSPDTNFGSDGTALISFPTDSFSVGEAAIQADNKIVLAGSAGNIKQRFVAVARLMSDGALDLTFSGDGRTNIAQSPSNTRANTVALQPDGKIVTGGSITSYDSSSGDFLLARFQASSCLANCFTLRQKAMDFDGDGKTDLSVFRPSDAYWYILNSSSGFSSVKWGLPNDRLVPGDYDGDGKTDLAVYRNSPDFSAGENNVWYILRSSDNTLFSRQFGKSTGFVYDAPVPADYDGDGKTDLAVYELQDVIGAPGSSRILQSSNNSVVINQWGLNTDKRVPADYDGDGKADLAIFRPSNGVWYVLKSRDGFTAVQFGAAEDKPVVGDYDGDGKADYAVFRPANGFWYVLKSTGNSFAAVQFGISTDKPVPGDYDGDGKTDYAVYRDGAWFVLSSNNGFVSHAFGTATDKPVPHTFVP